MVDEAVEVLREMAQHRGFKLIRSRRRKPGTGDFGKFGLEDESGKPIFGFGDEGLTARAEDIENFLRAGAVSTWQQSAGVTPDRPRRAPSAASSSQDHEDAVKPRKTGKGRSSRSAAQHSEIGPEAGRGATDGVRRASVRKAEEEKISAAAPRRNKRVAGTETKPQPKPTPKPKKEPEPELRLRLAKSSDAAPLSAMLRQLKISSDKGAIERSIAEQRRSGGGLLVATFGELVGCIGWVVLPTIQHGPLGRITIVVVDERHRRRGIATRLLAEAEAALKKKGCSLIEAMSDIDIRNSHGFFRSTDFVQASYRFTRKIDR